MRQLYGRRGRQDAPINISTFSVDEEYNNNELKRSLGLMEEVKPVRSIAPGKHQLSSLLNGEFAQYSPERPRGCAFSDLVCRSRASTEGCIGGKLCSGEKKQKGGWFKIWMVASSLIIYELAAEEYCFQSCCCGKGL